MPELQMTSGGSIGCGTGVSLAVTDYTFEFLLKRRTISYVPSENLCERHAITGAGYIMQIRVGSGLNGHIRVEHDTPVDLSEFVSASPWVFERIWTRIAITFSAGNPVNLYINAVLKEQSTLPFISPDAPVVANFTTMTDFQGDVAQVLAYNRQLSLAELQYNLYHPGNPIRRGIVLNMTQESFFGGAWQDLSAYGNDGVLSGSSVNPANNLSGRQVSL